MAAIPNPSPGPHEVLEVEEAGKKLMEWIWPQLKGEQEQEVFLCIVEGLDKPSVIAKEVGIPIPMVNQVLRNMRRRLQRARQEN